MSKRRTSRGTVSITKPMVIYDVTFPPGTYPFLILEVGLDRLGGTDWYCDSVQIDDPRPHPAGVTRNTFKVPVEEFEAAVKAAGGQFSR